MNKEITPEEYQKIDASASIIAKEQFGIKKQKNKHFIKHPTHPEIYMVGFGDGAKNDNNEKGFYAYWVWYQDKKPYGGMINCVLKDKYDSIDYFMSCMQNAEATIDEVITKKQDESTVH